MGIELQKFLTTPPLHYAQIKTEESGNVIVKTKPLPHQYDVRHMAKSGWNKDHTERNTQTAALFITALQKEFNPEIADIIARTHFDGREKAKPLSHDKIHLAMHMARDLKATTLVANAVTLDRFMGSELPVLLQKHHHPGWNEPAAFNQLCAMLKSHISEQGLQKLHPKDMPAIAAEVIKKAEALPETCVADLRGLALFVQSLDFQRTLQLLNDLSSRLAIHAQFDLGAQGPLGADDQVDYQREKLKTLLSCLSQTELMNLRDTLSVSPTCKELCSMLGSFEVKANVQEHIAESGELQDQQIQMMGSVFGSQALVISLLETLGEMLDGKENTARLRDWNESTTGNAQHNNPAHCDPEFVQAFARQLDQQAKLQASAIGLSSPPANNLERRYLPLGDNTQLRQGLEASAQQAEIAAPSWQFDLDFHRGTYILDGKPLDPSAGHAEVPALLRHFATQGTLASALLSLSEEHGMLYGVERQASRFYMSTMQDGSYLLSCRQLMSPSMLTTGGLEDPQNRVLDPALSQASFEINLHIGMEEGRCVARPTAPIVFDCRHYFSELDQA